MKQIKLVIMFIGICLGLVACGNNSEQPKYYSEIKEKQEINNDEKDSTEHTSDEENGFMESFSFNTSEKIENCNMTNRAYVAADEEYIYYAIYEYEINKAQLCRRKKDNSEDQTIFSMDGRIEHLAITEDRIFFTNDGLYSISKDGADFTMLIEEDLDGIYIDKGWIYYGNKYQIKQNGSELSTVYDSASVRGYSLNYYDGYAYFEELNSDTEHYEGISRRKIDSDKIESIFNGFVETVAVYDGYIYFNPVLDDYSTNQIYRAELDGTKQTEWVTLEKSPGYINAFDGWLYCCGSGITRINIDSGEMEKICEGDVYMPLIIDNWIYYLELPNGIGSNKIFRVKCDGSEKELFAE